MNDAGNSCRISLDCGGQEVLSTAGGGWAMGRLLTQSAGSTRAKRLNMREVEWISVLSEGSCAAWHGVDCVVCERGEGDLGRLRRIGALWGAWGDSFSEKPLLQRAAVSLRQSCVSSPCEKMAAVDRHAIRK